MLLQTENKEFIEIDGESSTWPQLMDSTSHRDLYAAELRRTGFSGYVNEFETKVKGSTLDAAKGNPLKDKLVVKGRKANWLLFGPIHCRCHAVQLLFQSVSHLVKEDVNGQPTVCPRTQQRYRFGQVATAYETRSGKVGEAYSSTANSGQ